MDIFVCKKDSQGRTIKKFSKNLLNQQLALAGLLSLSAFSFPFHIFAADLGSQSAGTIILNDGDKITADMYTNTMLYGVLNNYNTTANIDLANGVTVTAIDLASPVRGIIVNGTNSELKANGLTIDAQGTAAIGLDIAGSKNKIDLGSGSYITAVGSIDSTGYGIRVGGVSTLKATGLTIKTSGIKTLGLQINNYGTSVDLGSNSYIETNGASSSGITIFGSNGNASNGPATLVADNLTIVTKGGLSYGIDLQANSFVDLTNATINTTGAGSTGLWVLGELKAEGLNIDAKGSEALALEVRNSGVANVGAGSHLSSAQAGALAALGTNARANYLGTADNRNSVFSGGSYAVSAQSTGSIVKVAYTDIEIDRNGGVGLGLWALSGGQVIGDNLTITGAAGSRGVYAMANSQIDLTGDTTIRMASPSEIAIATQHNNGYAASRINLTGKVDITGAIISSGGMINVDMLSGSQWTGDAYSDNINGGQLNVSLTDGRWNMTADSNLDRLVLNNSTVDFTEDRVGSLLTVGDLSGNGTFILRTDIVGDGVNGVGDKLVVTGSSSGDHLLTVLNQGSLATTGNEVLTVVETQDGVATFRSSSQVELGGYLYDVRKNGTDWELYSSGIYVPPPEPEPQPEPEPEPQPEPEPEPTPNPGPSITTSADAGANFLNIGYLLNYAENQTLLQRMGDLRQHKQHGNMWLRSFAGKFDSFSGGKLSNFDMNYNGVQIGADKSISQEVPLFIGTFMGLTKGSPDYASGNGSVESHHMGMYGSYMASNGFYVDSVVKYSNLKNKFNVLDSQDNRVRGNGNASVVSASLEAGQKFNLSASQEGSHFYIEPQAQFTYSHQNAVGIKASNGLKIDLGSYESMLGRASAIIGYELQQGNSTVNAYLKTGYVREFAGDTDYRLNGSLEKHSFKGGWWNNGIGVSAQLDKQHTFYLDVESSTGNKFNQRQVNGGYRFSF